MTRSLFALAAFACGAGVLAAADGEKLDLKSFKWKADAGPDRTDLGGYDEGEGRFNFYGKGTATGEVAVPNDGEYTISVEASCTEALKEFAKFKLTVGDVVAAKEHALTAEGPKTYTLTAKLKKGKQPVVIEFLNDAYKDGEYDRNLFVHGVKVEKK
jgi:hypothetical protein